MTESCAPFDALIARTASKEESSVVGITAAC
jgi:hypothetical protein